jgi:hypothetical protein
MKLAGNYSDDEFAIAFAGDTANPTGVKVTADPPAAILANANIQFSIEASDALKAQLSGPVRIELDYGDKEKGFYLCDFAAGPCVLPGLHTYAEARTYQVIASFPDHETMQVGAGEVQIYHPFEYKGVSFSTAAQVIYPLDVVGDPKGWKGPSDGLTVAPRPRYYVLGASSTTEDKATIMYRYDFADGAVADVELIRDVAAAHAGEEWYIAGAEAGCPGTRWSFGGWRCGRSMAIPRADSSFMKARHSLQWQDVRRIALMRA